MSAIVPDNGRRLVIQLKECVQRLTSHDTAMTEKDQDAQSFCSALEVILLHGIKISEFNGAIPLWAFLERLENLTPPCIPLRNTIGAVASMPTFRTPIAKARAWIRQVLNAGHLDESVMFMMAQSQLLRTYYYAGALLLNAEEGMGLVAVLRSAKAIKFNFNIETDDGLQTAPAWMLRAIQEALQPLATPAATKQQGNTPGMPANPSRGSTPPPQPPQQQQQQPGTNLTSTFGSFLRSFETSLDSLLVKVDQVTHAANKFIDEQLEPTMEAAPGAARAAAAPIISAFTSTPGTYKTAVSASGARMLPFFGTPLKDLLLDERRTSHAFLNPLLGVPNQALRMINFVSARANTPDLFRRPVTLAVLTALRKDVEDERELAPTTDVAAVALLLMQWLNQLPEPLLGYEHYSAILACNEVENPDDKIRNLALLVQEASWYCKPLLVRVIALLFKCIQPEHAAQNNLNIIAVSVLSTPCLFRPYVAALHLTPHTYFHDHEGRERLHMSATATGSTTVEFIITHHVRILSRLREEQTQREAALAAKCARIVALQERVPIGIETIYVDYLDEQAQDTIRTLFEYLALAEKLIAPSNDPTTTGLSANHTPNGKISSAHSSGADLFSITNSSFDPLAELKEHDRLEISDILTHPRWEICGFTPKEMPFKDFNTTYGSLALQSLAGFMKRYHKQGAVMVHEYVQQRQCIFSLSTVLLQLTHFVVDILRLLPSPSTMNNTAQDFSSSQNSGENGKRNVTPIQVIAKQASWVLLSDEAAFQELFDLAVLTFEDSWKTLSAPLQLQLQLPSPAAPSSYPNSNNSNNDNSGNNNGGNSNMGKYPGGAQCLSQCLSKTYGTLHEIVHKRRPRSIQQMWEIWLGLRLAEQERQAHLKLSTYTPTSPASASSMSPLSLWRDVSSGNNSTSSHTDNNSHNSGHSNGNSSNSIGIAAAGVSAQASPKTGEVKGLGSAVVTDTVEVLSSVMSALSAQVSSSTTNASASTSSNSSSSSSNNNSHNNNTKAPGSAPSSTITTHHPSASQSTTGVDVDEFNLDEAEEWLNNNATSTSTSNNKIPLSNFSLAEDFDESEWENANAFLDKFSPTKTITTATAITSTAATSHTDNKDKSKTSTSSLPPLDTQTSEHAAPHMDLPVVSPVGGTVAKSSSDVVSRVRGRSQILTPAMIQQIEQALPTTYQCYDWELIYRLSDDGANVNTLVHQAKAHCASLLVVQDTNGAVFGALITEQLKMGEKEKYYGNGTIAVWSFVTGELKYYPWSFKNSYFLITSKDSLALGGGGHFAIYLDGELNHGSSGACATFASPCLASQEEFSCQSCELFALSTSLLGF